ncbi:MAG: glycosyltransferase family 9 protein [Bernardetiaceae bacterium]
MKLLLIQTAFIGDVILMTAALEELHALLPEAQLDVLVRSGTESLFVGHPFVGQVLVFEKRQSRRRELVRLFKLIRPARYDAVLNFHRFASTGLLALLSGARRTLGFDKNPLSLGFGERVRHRFEGQHEVSRNRDLIRALGVGLLPERPRPRLYPRPQDYTQAAPPSDPYICIAPASVWFTKQLPAERWVAFLGQLPEGYHVQLLGGPNDRDLCHNIAQTCPHLQLQNRAGSLGFLASAALMQGAQMNYVNDSAPLHLASAVNAPVAAVFCSTVPRFGFTPLSSVSFLIETTEQLSCRPCGLHGKKSCPKGHFACANIRPEQLLAPLDIPKKGE